MKNAKKIVALLLCAILLIGCSVVGTLAFLKAETKTVQNTFTVGKVSLGEEDEDGKVADGLNEAKVNEYGEKLNAAGEVAKEGDSLADRVLENTYKLIPNHTYVKDPTIHVASGSEPCYLFVKVENGIAAIEDKTENGNTIAAQMEANGWKVLDAENGLYYLDHKVDTLNNAEGVATDVPVFASFKLAKDAKVADYASAKINITAYAVQADGFADAAAAWAASFGA